MAKLRITIIGLGLIGGSIGLALKRAKVDAEIIGHDKDASAASRAQKRGAVDKTEWNLHSACNGAGLVILAIPLAGVKDTLAVLGESLEAGALVTDTATSKVSVMEWAKQLAPGVQFIGGDPALSPKRAGGIHGIDAADADLFQGATYSLTASTTAASSAIETMSNFVALLGAKPYFIDAAEHDGLLTGVQHLPALLATALTATTVLNSSWHELGKLAGSDFRTATDLTPQDPKTASEQFLAHRDDLIRWIDTLQAQLKELRGMIERGDDEAIQKLVDKLSDERAKWLAGNIESSGPAIDWQSAQPSIGRLFIGGMADRIKKPK